ncbi:hypothetical protein ENSA5_24640 [Enhygromyxa salina]|uniref:Lipoprotein n=1 Tax=Enhygromyxa salina TaxID=215803 RepID=A0A2S9YBC3_9BACT|nr:hypothetical protein [Enhygromyxa salina]PRQ02311.1 hypothetical protein ENSA5_24640 [Enhygromyxa salina]
MRTRLLSPLVCLALLGSGGCADEPKPSGSTAAAKQAEAPAGEVEPPANTPSTAPAPAPTPDPEAGPSAEPSELAAAPDEGPETPKAKLPSAVLDAAKSGYELLAPGVEPLAALRFGPKVGQVERIKLTMTMQMSISGPGMPPTVQKLPPLEQINRAETVSVADGRIEEKITFESFAVDSEGVDAQMAAMMQSTMEEISGFEQTVVYDDRGGVIEGDLDIPDDASPQLAKTLETMGQTFEQVMVRLPEPAIGVGAKWKETSEFDNNGIKLEQTSQLELVAREGDKITLDTQITQRPLTKKFTPPNMPMGEVDLLEFDSKGGGRVVYDLGKLMPDEVNTTVETKFTVEATIAGQTQKLTTEIEIELQLERLDP